MKRSQACAFPAAHKPASSRSAAYGDPATTSIMLFLPKLSPPRILGQGAVVGPAGALDDVGDVPARQRCKASGFLLMPVAQLRAIRRHRAARVVARPRVAQDVASLEVAAIGGLLEHQILGEVRVVVPHMQP